MGPENRAVGMEVDAAPMDLEECSDLFPVITDSATEASQQRMSRQQNFHCRRHLLMTILWFEADCRGPAHLESLRLLDRKGWD